MRDDSNLRSGATSAVNHRIHGSFRINHRGAETPRSAERGASFSSLGASVPPWFISGIGADHGARDGDGCPVSPTIVAVSRCAREKGVQDKFSGPNKAAKECWTCLPAGRACVAPSPLTAWTHFGRTAQPSMPPTIIHSNLQLDSALDSQKPHKFVLHPTGWN